VAVDVDVPRAATLERSDARRNLAGAQLVGPVADRNLVSHVNPVYPEWAKREAVEASVTLYFLVLPDGRVKENVLVDKTSGFGDFDENAVNAILQWRFEAIAGTREQWGSITFHFRLTDGS
jgi:TonB family protein